MPKKSTENFTRVRGKDKKKDRFKHNGKFTSKHLRLQENLMEKRNQHQKK